MSSFQLIFNKHCHMVDIGEVINLSKKDLVCVNIHSSVNYKSIPYITPGNAKNVKYLRFLGCWRFEHIVKTISLMEDKYKCPIDGIDIEILENKKLFFDLIDFYGADISISVIANFKITPFEIVQDLFSSPELSSFYRYGISLDINNLDGNLWLNDNVFRSIKNYVFAYSDSRTKIYGIR